jgi:DNA-binding transcriptional LysR family regulator
VSVLPDSLQIEKVELMPNSLYLIANSDQKIATGIQDKSIIETLSIIYREEGSGTRFVMEKFIENNQLTVPKKMVLTSNEAIKQAVLAGLGCSIMPLIGIKNELSNQELQIIPFKGLPIKTTWSLIWLKGKKHGPVAAALLDYMHKEKDNIVKEKFNWYENY